MQVLLLYNNPNLMIVFLVVLGRFRQKWLNFWKYFACRLCHNWTCLLSETWHYYQDCSGKANVIRKVFIRSRYILSQKKCYFCLVRKLTSDRGRSEKYKYYELYVPVSWWPKWHTVIEYRHPLRGYSSVIKFGRRDILQNIESVFFFQPRSILSE